MASPRNPFTRRGPFRGPRFGGTRAYPPQYSPELAQFLARITDPGDTRRALYAALIDGLVTDGVWAKLDALYMYAAANSATGVVNLVSNRYTCVVNGSPAFAADKGFTGVDASTTDYLNTQFNPSTAPSPKFTQNSAHVSVWSLTNATSGPAGGDAISIVSAGNVSVVQIAPQYNDGNSYVRANDSVPYASGFVTANSTGHYIANRSGASTQQAYLNAVDQGVTAVASAAVAPVDIYVLARDLEGTGATVGGGYQIAMASIGGSLSSADATNFYNRVRTYLSAVGAIGVTMTADTGAFVETGKAAVLTPAAVAAKGSYVETGIAATLKPSVVGTKATFTEAGKTAVLTPKVVAAVRSYALTGRSSLLTPAVSGTKGTFSESGKDATFRVNLIAATRSYAETGKSSVLTPSVRTAVRAYNETGRAAPLEAILRTVTQSYTLVGQDAALIPSGTIPLMGDPGVFLLTGIDANLVPSAPSVPPITVDQAFAIGGPTLWKLRKFALEAAGKRRKKKELEEELELLVEAVREEPPAPDPGVSANYDSWLELHAELMERGYALLMAIEQARARAAVEAERESIARLQRRTKAVLWQLREQDEEEELAAWLLLQL